jgi:hypothetical protein
MAHPLPLTVVSSVWAVFLVAFVLLAVRDSHLDRRAIKQLYIADSRFVHEARRSTIALERLRTFAKRDVRKMDMGHFWNLRSVLHRHMWLSTGWRAPTSNFSSIGRALTLLIFTLGTFTVRLAQVIFGKILGIWETVG